MDNQLTPAWTVLLIVLVAWELVWKGLALWRAARNDQPAWFIVLLIINSVGILPIIYLLTHRKPPATATPTP
ncbi:MAG: DUF5652 family protein [Pseudonocardiaceae bacterium]